MDIVAFISQNNYSFLNLLRLSHLVSIENIHGAFMPVQEFYDKQTNTLSYIVYNTSSTECIVIDPVLNFDAHTGKICFLEIHRYQQFIAEKKLKPMMCLETHVHADHLSGAQFLKQLYPQLVVAISERIVEVQAYFGEYFNISYKATGADFDLILEDKETYKVGNLQFKTLATPGHTPACTSFLFQDSNNPYVFTGDVLFMPDSGTGRCDFPDGSATQLYRSITEQLYTLPESTITYTGHDYQPSGRKLEFSSTIGVQKKQNISLNNTISEADFVDFREKRDLTLNPPKLLLPSIQVNMVAGKLPEKTGNDWCFLKLPIHISDQLKT